MWRHGRLRILADACRASLPAAHQQLIESSSPRVLAAAPDGPATKPAEGLASNAASITAWPGVQPPTLLPTMPAQPSSNGLHPQQSDAPPAAPLPPLKTAQQPGAGEVQEPLSPSAARAASVVNWPLSGSVSRDGKPSNGGDAESLFGSAGPLVRPKRTGGVDYSCGCMDYGVRRCCPRIQQKAAIQTALLFAKAMPSLHFRSLCASQLCVVVLSIAHNAVHKHPAHLALSSGQR